MPALADAHAALLRNGALQFDLPPAESPRAPEPEPLHLALGLGHIDAVWLLVGIAAAVILAAVWIYRQGRVPPAAGPAAAAASAPDVATPALARTALADGDRFASEGRFLEATRALLACGLGVIAERHPERVPPTATSRDVARDPALPAPLRSAFGRIAATVEAGLFAGRPLGAADYAACRQVFVASALARPA